MFYANFYFPLCVCSIKLAVDCLIYFLICLQNLCTCNSDCALSSMFANLFSFHFRLNCFCFCVFFRIGYYSPQIPLNFCEIVKLCISYRFTREFFKLFIYLFRKICFANQRNGTFRKCLFRKIK